ncbi:MAG: asparagine synthase (glutamine-hydrolyzing) [Gemmatimonadaceae bacterium]
MCGIAGVVRFDGLAPSLALLQAQARSLTHRGPDSSGHWTDGPVGLVHTRLAIVDLSRAGDQPMTSPDGRVTLVYNGELYNTSSLRSALAVSQWRGHSDTEVLLNTFCEHGPASFELLEGMFAFAVYDAVHGELWLVRDPFGIKPLYYHANERRLVFASEVRPLLLDPETPRAPNMTALRQHLLLGYAADPLTAFDGIQRLPAAHALCVQPNGTVRAHRYWDERQLFDLTVLPAYEGLCQSVERQSVSDVPMGLFLSSGLDSSLIASALATTGRSAAFAAFNVRLDPDEGRATDAGRVERRVAEATASRFAMPFVKVRSDVDAIPSIQAMIETVEEPIANPSNALIDRVCEVARAQGTKVLLTGHGGDEVFAGYRRHVWARYAPIAGRAHLGPLLRMVAAVSDRSSIRRMADSLQSGAALHPLVSVSSVGWTLVMQGEVCPTWFPPGMVHGTVGPLLELLGRWREHTPSSK